MTPRPLPANRLRPRLLPTLALALTAAWPGPASAPGPTAAQLTQAMAGSPSGGFPSTPAVAGKQTVANRKKRERAKAKAKPAAANASGAQEAAGSAVPALAPPAPVQAAPTRAPAEPKRLGGFLLKPGADLRGLNFSFKTFPPDTDLTGADLRRAICIGTRFNNTIMSGARLAGAQLFGAEIDQAVDIDLTGAELHAFFDLHSSSRVGSINYFSTLLDPGDAGAYPSSLVSLPDGHLFWLQGQSPRMRYLSPTGDATRLIQHEDQRILGIVGDRDRLWYFGERERGVLLRRDPVRHGPGPRYVLSTQASTFTDVPDALAAFPGEDKADSRAVLLLGHRLMAFKFSADNLHSDGTLKTGYRPEPTDRLLATRDGRRLLVHGARRNSILVLGMPGLGLQDRAIDLPAGSGVAGMVQDPGSRVWFTGTDPDAVVAYDLEAGKIVAAHPLKDRTPGRIAMGADGRPWFTLPQRCAIARLAPSGEVEEFPLGPGMEPGELVPAHDGRLLFTVKGMNLIGAIRTRPPTVQPAIRLEPKDAAPEGKGSSPHPVPSSLESPAAAKAAPEEVRPGMLARTALPDSAPLIGPEAAQAAPELRSTAEPPTALAADSGEHKEKEALVPDLGAAPGAAPPSSRPSPPLAAAPRRSHPAPRLEAMNIHLTDGDLTHIFNRHTTGRSGQDGRFVGPYASRKGLAQVLTQGLLDAGEIARVVSRDRYNRFVTYCQVPHAGECYDPWNRAWFRTDRFVVITNRYVRNGFWHFDVVTAYPVP